VTPATEPSSQEPEPPRASPPDDPNAPMSHAERWLDARISRKGVRPRDAAIMIAGFWAIAVVGFGVLERIVDPKTFHTVWLGIWWAIQTVTTVGYGDVVPDQPVGKAIAGVLMLGGLSLLSVVTAAITSGFVARAESRRSPTDPLLQNLERLHDEIQALRTELEQGRAALSKAAGDAGHEPTNDRS
jgi:voltage-gated potassium channel